MGFGARVVLAASVLCLSACDGLFELAPKKEPPPAPKKPTFQISVEREDRPAAAPVKPEKKRLQEGAACTLSAECAAELVCAGAGRSKRCLKPCGASLSCASGYFCMGVGNERSACVPIAE